MSGSQLPYELWIEEALRGVVRRALEYTAVHSLPGSHHFYITFVTGAPGVDIPAPLKAKYPNEMTIVLQHQFWDLEVNDASFCVTLKFQGRPNRLFVPLDAITAFGDPSVNFGLSLRSASGETETADLGSPPETPIADSDAEAGDSAPGPTGEVIALDTFRKK